MMRTILCVITICSTLFSQAQQWHVATTPRGRTANDITIFSPGNLLVTGGNRFNDSIQSAFTTSSGGIAWNIDLDILQGWFTSTDFKDSLNGISVASGGRIKATTNGGRNWVSVPSPVNRDFNKIVFLNSLTGFIAGGSQDTLQTILRTTDEGQSWSVVHDQQGQWLKSIGFVDGNTGFAVGDSGTILKTTNGGNSWAPIAAPIQRSFNAIVFTDASNGIIVGGNPANDSLRTILATTNGGNSWNVVKDEFGGILTDVFFLDGDNGYAVGEYATLLATTDGGQNWAVSAVAPAVPTEHFYSVNFHDANYGVIGGSGGRVFIYSAALAVPEVFTLGSEHVTSTTADMVAGINTHGNHAQYWFNFSTSNDFSSGFQTIPDVIQSDVLARAEKYIYQLMPNTTYYYMATARTLAGTAYGDTLTFFTGTPNKEAYTLEATEITGNSAKLNGFARGFNEPVALYFQYGLTPAVTNQVAASPDSVFDNMMHPVEATIGSLTPQRVFYFRIKAVTTSGTIYGDIRAFYTGAAFNSIETLLPTILSETRAELHGSIRGLQFPGIAGFDYGIDSVDFRYRARVLVDSLVSDTARHVFTAALDSVVPGRFYYYRFKVETHAGVFYGDTLAFYTGDFGVQLQTLYATEVTSSSATLTGSVQQFSFPVNLSFEYGTTLSFNSEVTAAPAAIDDSLYHAVSADISGLLDNTIYYYRIKAETNAGVKFFGPAKQLFTGSSTIPNWDFQHWEMETRQIPEGWNLSGDFEQVAGHTGDHAIRLEQRSFALLGHFYEGNDDAAFFGGIPLYARPDSISAYLNYDIEPGDTGIVIVQLSSSGVMLGGGFFMLTGNSGGVFQRVSFAIPYSSGDVPDSAAIGFTPSNPENRINTGSYMIIDDISFSHNSTVIPHGDFENWFDYTHNKLLSWFYNAYIDIDSNETMITRVIHHSPDDYAAEIMNQQWSAGYFGGAISTRFGFDEWRPSFPVQAKHLTLNGYYTYSPENGDTMEIEVAMYHGATLIGEGTFYQGNTVDEFTPFEVPINYLDQTLIPDSASITISAFKSQSRGTSRCRVDKLRFDGLPTAIDPVRAAERNDFSIHVFPNPSASVVTIQLEKETAATLEIYDLRGRVLHKHDFRGSKLNVSTQDFPEGFYVISVIKDGKRVTSKLLVIR